MLIQFNNTTVISVLYNTWELVKQFCRIQSKSTLNPLYKNTSTLCHCANLKSFGKFYEKFSVNTYGIFKIKEFNPVKMICFMKLIFEDIIQLVIQIMFLMFWKVEISLKCCFCQSDSQFCHLHRDCISSSMTIQLDCHSKTSSNWSESIKFSEF